MRRLVLLLLLVLPTHVSADEPERLTRSVSLFGCFINTRLSSSPMCTSAVATILVQYTGVSYSGYTTVAFSDANIDGLGLVSFDATGECFRLQGNVTPSCMGSFFGNPWETEITGATGDAWVVTPAGLGKVSGTFTTTPEPASVLLLGTGLLGLVALHRRTHPSGNAP